MNLLQYCICITAIFVKWIETSPTPMSEITIDLNVVDKKEETKQNGNGNDYQDYGDGQRIYRYDCEDLPSKGPTHLVQAKIKGDCNDPPLHHDDHRTDGHGDGGTHGRDDHGRGKYHYDRPPRKNRHDDGHRAVISGDSGTHGRDGDGEHHRPPKKDRHDDGHRTKIRHDSGIHSRDVDGDGDSNTTTINQCKEDEKYSWEQNTCVKANDRYCRHPVESINSHYKDGDSFDFCCNSCDCECTNTKSNGVCAVRCTKMGCGCEDCKKEECEGYMLNKCSWNEPRGCISKTAGHGTESHGGGHRIDGLRDSRTHGRDDHGGDDGKVMEPTAVREISLGNLEFAQNLCQSLRKEMEGRNLVMSPYSVSSVMAMVSVGARRDTWREIKAVMGFPSYEVLIIGYHNVLKELRGNENFTLETANSMFVQDGFKMRKNFEKVLKAGFYTKVKEVNFAASEEATQLINDWVADKTKEKIKDLIPEGYLNSQTIMVLVNAIYFKGDWVRKFDKEETKDANFYLEENNVGQTKMMHIQLLKVKLAILKNINAKVIELPYKGNRISMYILLPNEKFGLGEVEKKLYKTKLIKLSSKIEASKKSKVELFLPKFKLETSIPLTDHMKQLGIIQMFSPRADFSGISDNSDLRVTDVIQKAFIEVNEEGSEAAAATGLVVQLKMAGPPPSPVTQFICDHPFMFFIKDKLTDMLLFSGKVMDPTDK